MIQHTDIPVDVYDSPQETVIIIPLGGVEKQSIVLQIQGNELIVQGKRTAPQLKPLLRSVSQQCFWGVFTRSIKLPTKTAFEKIHSTLSPENVLTIIVPHVIVPTTVAVEIQ